MYTVCPVPGGLVVQARLEDLHEASQAPPMVHSITGALGGCGVAARRTPARRVVLADVARLPPHAREHLPGLRCQRRSRLRHGAHVRVPWMGETSVDELYHRPPDVAAPVTERRESRVRRCDARQRPKAAVGIPCAPGRHAEMRGRGQGRHHPLSLLGCRDASLHSVEAGR